MEATPRGHGKQRILPPLRICDKGFTILGIQHAIDRLVCRISSIHLIRHARSQTGKATVSDACYRAWDGYFFDKRRDGAPHKRLILKSRHGRTANHAGHHHACRKTIVLANRMVPRDIGRILFPIETELRSCIENDIRPVAKTSHSIPMGRSRSGRAAICVSEPTVNAYAFSNFLHEIRT